MNDSSGGYREGGGEGRRGGEGGEMGGRGGGRGEVGERGGREVGEGRGEASGEGERWEGEGGRGRANQRLTSLNEQQARLLVVFVLHVCLDGHF